MLTLTSGIGPPSDHEYLVSAATRSQAYTHVIRGFINSFGVFQTYYVTTLNRPPSDISWVGSIQVFLLFFIGTFTGRLTDAGYFRQVFIIGSFLGVFGLFMTSLSTNYWQLFLAQGVCCGLGNGCLFCPSLSLLSTYFTKKRSLAIGLAAAGSATGGMVFPAMVQQLLPKVGFPWTIRALGFIQLGCLIICNIGMKQRIPPRRAGALVDWASFKERPYTLFAVGMFFVSQLDPQTLFLRLIEIRTSGEYTLPFITWHRLLGVSLACPTRSRSIFLSLLMASVSWVELSPIILQTGILDL